MCDNINSYGAEESILSILKQLLIQEDKDKKYRVFLLGMEKEAELENITGCEEDRNRDKATKIKEAKRVLEQDKILFSDKNYIFTDPAFGIELSKKRIMSACINQIQSARQEFWINIDNSLNYMWSQYYAEMNNCLDILEKFSHKEINPDTMKKINSCLENAKMRFNQLKDRENGIAQKVSNVINSIVPASLRGAVNHWGIGNTANIYGIFQKCSGNEFEEQCRELKNSIIDTNKIFFDSPTEWEKICLNFMNDQVNTLYQKYYEEYREYIYSNMYENLYNAQSWTKAQSWWGDGLGDCRNRVWCNIDEQINEHNIQQVLTSQEYMFKFADSVISLFTI